MEQQENCPPGADFSTESGFALQKWWFPPDALTPASSYFVLICSHISIDECSTRSFAGVKGVRGHPWAPAWKTKRPESLFAGRWSNRS